MSVLQTRKPTSGMYPLEVKGRVSACVCAAVSPVATKLSGQMSEWELLHPGVLCGLGMSE